MTEEFRPIKDFERYYVSNFGRVLNTETGRFLKFLQTKKGYFSIALSKEGKQQRFLVHRLVAQAFIPNPDNLDTVDHIGSKTDNRVSNLRWLSRSDNASRFYKEQITEEQREHYKAVAKENLNKAHELCKKPIICLETGKVYESILQAGRELNISHGNIANVLDGKRKQTHGLHFKYLLE